MVGCHGGPLDQDDDRHYLIIHRHDRYESMCIFVYEPREVFVCQWSLRHRVDCSDCGVGSLPTLRRRRTSGQPLKTRIWPSLRRLCSSFCVACTALYANTLYPSVPSAPTPPDNANAVPGVVPGVLST